MATAIRVLRTTAPIRALSSLRFAAPATATINPFQHQLRSLCDKPDDTSAPSQGLLARFFTPTADKRNPFLAALGYYSRESRAIGAGRSLYSQALKRADAAAAAEGDIKAFGPRFEMLSVHVYLTLRRLRLEKGSPYEADVKTVMQCLFDVFWTDVRTRMLIDEQKMQLLESARWVKECEQRFFGLAVSFDEAWDDEEQMRQVISRNVTCLNRDQGRVERFRRYMQRERLRLEEMTVEEIWGDQVWDDGYGKVRAV